VAFRISEGIKVALHYSGEVHHSRIVGEWSKFCSSPDWVYTTFKTYPVDNLKQVTWLPNVVEHFVRGVLKRSSFLGLTPLGKKLGLWRTPTSLIPTGPRPFFYPKKLKTTISIVKSKKIENFALISLLVQME